MGSSCIGRGKLAGPKFLWTLCVLIIAVLTGAAVEAHRYRTSWTALQREHFPAYVRSHILAGLHVERGRYRLLYVTDRKGQRLASDNDVQPAITPSGEPTLVPSEGAIQAGAKRLVWQAGRYTNLAIQDFLPAARIIERPIASIV